MLAEQLTISCEPLDEFRENLNLILKALIDALVTKGLTTGEVTAKLKVTISPQAEPDGSILHMMEIEPKLGKKIGAKGEAKCKKQTGIFMKYDQDENIIIGERQMDIDEYIRNE